MLRAGVPYRGFGLFAIKQALLTACRLPLTVSLLLFSFFPFSLFLRQAAPLLSCIPFPLFFLLALLFLLLSLLLQLFAFWFLLASATRCGSKQQP